MNNFRKNVDLIRELDPELFSRIKIQPPKLSNINLDTREKRFSLFEISLKGTKELIDNKSDLLGPFTAHSSPINGINRDGFWLGHEDHGDTDCHVKLLLEELRRNLSSRACLTENGTSINQKRYSAIVLLGPPSLGEVINIIKHCRPLFVITFYKELNEWTEWLLDPNLIELKHALEHCSGKFSTRKSTCPVEDACQIIRRDLLGFVGDSLLIANSSDRNYSKAIEHIRGQYMSMLRPMTGGPCVDELIMLKHSCINLKQQNSLLLRQVAKKSDDPFVIIGSGPSLDDSLEAIKSLSAKCHIVSAGSSIRTLLRAGIYPDFHVHVERGGNGRITDLYEKVLAENGMTSFERIIGITPSSVEPTLLNLYQEVILYSRGGQSPISKWPWLCKSVLDFEGPQCVSAAFAFAAHLRPSHIFLFGCDMGASSPNRLRSREAAGEGSRVFPKLVPGNFSSTVSTNDEIIQQLPYMLAAFNACNIRPRVFNCSDGVKVPFAMPLTLHECKKIAVHKQLSKRELLKFSSVRSDNIKREFRGLIVGPSAAESLSWIEEWKNLCDQAVDLPSPIIRAKASRLLRPQIYSINLLLFNVLKGSIRDGFWLTANAVERSDAKHSDRRECWAALKRTLLSLEYEMQHLESVMGDNS